MLVFTGHIPRLFVLTLAKLQYVIKVLLSCALSGVICGH